MKIINAIFIVLLSTKIFAQGGAQADLKFEEAEIAFNKKDYHNTIKKLDEFDELYGFLTTKSLFIRIVSQDMLFDPSRLFEDISEYKLLTSLRKNTSTYLKAMEGEVLDDRYRTVMKINNKLQQWKDVNIQQITFHNGTYIGEIYDGLKHGKGKMIFSNSDVYSGSWQQNFFHGKGKMIYSNKSIYEGDWNQGLKDGHGKMKFNNSDYYSGNWQNDLFHGIGKMIYADNSVYEGQWDKGMKNGSGQMTYSNGDHFSGYWSQNRIQNGTLSKGNGETLSGEFNEKGILVSGTHKKPNGEYFSGRFSEDGVFQSGTIKIFLSNGDDYEGDYLDGKFTGKGKFVYADGSSYEGELVDGKKNGNGIYKTKRYEITGNWSYDERNGTKKKLYLDQIFTQKYGYTSLGISYTGFPLSSERSVNQVLVNFSYYTPKFINFGFGLGTFGVKDYYSYYEVYDPYPVYIYKPINNTSSITKNITAFNAEANIGVHVDLYRRITLKCNYSINATGVSKTIDYEVYKDYNNTENYSYIMEGSIWTHGLQPEIMFNSRILHFGLFFRKSIIHDTYPKFVYHNPVYDPVQIITFNNLPNSLNFVGFRLNFRID